MAEASAVQQSTNNNIANVMLITANVGSIFEDPKKSSHNLGERVS